MTAFGHLIGKGVIDATVTVAHFGYTATLDQPDQDVWERDSTGELFSFQVADGTVTSFSRWTEKPALTIDPIARRKR